MTRIKFWAQTSDPTRHPDGLEIPHQTGLPQCIEDMKLWPANKSSCLPSSFLSENVEIICPDDLYKENPEYGLRDIALRVVDALKQNKQVVINDELRYKSTRKSLLDTIRKKVLSCEVQLVQVIPEYGFLQMMWSQQFSHSTVGDTTNSKDEQHLRRWFDESLQNIDYSSGFVDKPSEKEGYSMEMLLVPLQVTSLFKLEFPALFFQWEAVLNEKEEISSQVEVLCGHWVTQNPCGRIIFIYGERNITKGIQQPANDSNNFITCLKQLALKIKHPVYAIHTSSTLCSGSFCVPPQPGILAFLHLHHLLNLQSKSTCYIFSDVNHMRMAEAAGVRHLKISSCLKSPDMVLKGQGITPSVPGLLRTMVVKKPNSKCGSLLPQIPTVPLFNCRHEMKDGHVSHNFENGLIEYVFVKDIQSFCRYQEEFAHHVTPTDHPGSKLISMFPAEPSKLVNKEKVSSGSSRSSNNNSNINIPHWMRKRRPRHDSEDERCIRALHGSAGPSSAKNNRTAKTVYVMSEKEAVAMARQLLLQANHEDLVTTVDKTDEQDHELKPA